jgi:glycosyltransferase involved in cell wall biosynthesis
MNSDPPSGDLDANGRPPRLRVVMYVTNDVTHDIRVIREAAALAAAGHTVTLMARMSSDSTLPEHETHDGFEIVRVRAVVDWLPAWRGRLTRIERPWRAAPALGRRIGAGLRRPPAGWLRAVGWAAAGVVATPWVAYRLIDQRLLGGRAPTPRPGGTLDWAVRWRSATFGWAEAAGSAAPPADVHHGHDLTGLPAAIRGADRDRGLAVYDSHELFVETESHAHRPWLARRWLATIERRLARRVAALVSVNRTLADLLVKRLSLGRLPPARVVVVHNAPPRWTPPEPRPDHLKQALGLPTETPVVLYHGGFTLDRGLLPLADAMSRPGLEAAHLVYLGYGPLREALVARAGEPRSGGRIHVLDAVDPEQLAEWVASADVGAMPNQPTTANERLSTPNKLFECLAAGVPVVTADYPERRRIVLEDPGGPLGAVCDATDPGSIAAAIRSLLDLPPDVMTALRARVLAAAHARWNWETESAKIVALYESLAAEIAGRTTR